METKKQSNGKSAIGSVIATLVLAAVCVTGGWIARGLVPTGKMMGPPPRSNLVSVAVTNAEMRVYNLPEKFVAHAEALQEVDLLPQVDGYVKAILFKEGDIVKVGQELYVLDDERYQAVVNQRKADLAAAEAEERRTKRYYERMQSADERGITQLERDNAEAAYERAKAAVLQAKANLVVAEYDCKKAKVFAPISGQIGKTSAHVGDYVAPSKGALARIVQIDPIRVSFPMTDRAYVGWRQMVKAGTAPEFRMRLVLPDGSAYDREGQWDFDDNQMSKETATIMMRLKFPNPDRLLIPNSYVTLVTDFKKPPSYLSLPQQCVIDLSGGSTGVWIVKKDKNGDDIVEQRVVEVKEHFNGWSPVVSGLKAGERVVLSGTGKLATGMKVVFAQPTPNDDIDPKYVKPIEE